MPTGPMVLRVGHWRLLLRPPPNCGSEDVLCYNNVFELHVAYDIL